MNIILLMYEHTLTLSQAITLLFAFLLTLVAYLFKDIPVIGKVWYVIKIFWVVVFGTLMASFLKKEIKEWWDKD